MSTVLEHKKKGELEAVRGLATCSVIAGHFFSSFYNPLNISGIFASLYSGLTNGGAAVVVFFVLSGFVLPISFYKSNGDSKTIAVSVINRFPRLFLIIFVSVMGTYAATRLGFNFSKSAADISHSEWFSKYGYPEITEYFRPDLPTALWHSTFGVILDNRNEFNVSLWTMSHEFYGSFIALSFAMIAYKARTPVMLVVTFMAIIALQYTAWRLTPFVVGAAISALIYSKNNFSVKMPISLLFVALGCLFYKFHQSDIPNWPISYYPWGSDEQKTWFIYTLSGLFFVIGAIGNEKIRSILNARILVFIGRISFAMYALHMMVMSTAVSFIYIHASNYTQKYALLITSISFIILLVVSSFVLTVMDEAWIKMTKKTIKNFVNGKK